MTKTRYKFAWLVTVHFMRVITNVELFSRAHANTFCNSTLSSSMSSERVNECAALFARYWKSCGGGSLSNPTDCRWLWRRPAHRIGWPKHTTATADAATASAATEEDGQTKGVFHVVWSGLVAVVGFGWFWWCYVLVTTAVLLSACRSCVLTAKPFLNACLQSISLSFALCLSPVLNSAYYSIPNHQSYQREYMCVVFVGVSFGTLVYLLMLIVHCFLETYNLHTSTLTHHTL